MQAAVIPSNILYFWHDLEKIPDVMQNSIRITRENNPDYTMIFSDDKQILQELETYSQHHSLSTLKKLYLANKIPASRSDIARLIMLYKHGGIYLDVSIGLHTGINSLIETQPPTELLFVKRDDNIKYHGTDIEPHVINGFMGMPAESQFAEHCLELIVDNLLSGELNHLVNYATGPAIINRALEHYKQHYHVTKLSYLALNKDNLSHFRAAGHSHTWVEQQKKGIIDYATLSI